MVKLADYASLLRGTGYDVQTDAEMIIVTQGGKTVCLGQGKDLEDLVADRTSVAQLWADHRLNDCAIMTFRDTADGDYIAARLAFREKCYEQFLWSAEQALEKYLKCILVLRRIPRPPPDRSGRRTDVGHDLSRGIHLIGTSTLELSAPTLQFIKYIDRTALAARYFEISTVANGDELVSLDRAVWELRRFCTSSEDYSGVKLREGVPAPKIRLGGRLERVIDKPKSPGREALLWQNAFFGRRVRKIVKRPRWGFSAKNAPLFVMPDVLKEFAKYAYVPDQAVKAYEALAEQQEAARTQQTERTGSAI